MQENSGWCPDYPVDHIAISHQQNGRRRLDVVLDGELGSVMDVNLRQCISIRATKDDVVKNTGDDVETIAATVAKQHQGKSRHHVFDVA